MTKVTFKNERRNLESTRNNSSNELIRGLIAVMLESVEFDCDNKVFRARLFELIEEYDRLEKEFVVKNIKGCTPELKDLIERTAFMLSHILEETDKQSNVSEINLSAYLARLSQYTNIINSKYSSIIKSLEHKTTILEKIRNWSPIKKFIVGTAFVGAVGGGALEANALLYHNANNSTNNANVTTVTTKTIEVKKEVQKKAATVEYHTAMTNVEVVKQLSKPIADTIPKAPAGFKYFSTATAKVTAYNPTGPGLMARGYPERGITSTGRDAINNLDGVAIDPKLIPYGSMVYIINGKTRNVWKLADDTGHLIREDGDKGITHIDIRAKSYKWAINYGKKDLIVHVFVPNSYKPSP